MIKALEVEIKNNYGNEVIYPVCNTSKSLAKLSGKLTLTRDAIDILKHLGFKFIVKKRTI